MTLTAPATPFIRAYLRASTDEQDAQRARGSINRFAFERNLTICNYYVENESGARLHRPQLFRLLDDCHPRDVLLLEDVDRLSRLDTTEWEKLKNMIRQREIKVVAVNVPTTWQHLAPVQSEFDARIFGAINDMLLDMLAAIARRDYEQRRERQAQGIEKAKAAGKYQGRPRNQERYDVINTMLANGVSWNGVQRTIGCSRNTISVAVKQAKKINDTVNMNSVPQPEAISEKTITTILWLHIENGSKFTRGKKRATVEVEDFILSYLGGEKINAREYRIIFKYEEDADLKEQIEEMFYEIHNTADRRNCEVVDYSLKNSNEQGWREYEGQWS